MLTTAKGMPDTSILMEKIVRLPPQRQFTRPHHIEDWADTLGLSQADLAKALGADKSIVSRWYSGSSPSKAWQKRLAEFFGIDREALFRHPAEATMLRLLLNRTDEERARIIAMIEAAFPRGSAKDGTKG